MAQVHRASDFDPTKPAQSLRFILPANPVSKVGGPRTSVTRDRFLSLEELAKVWRSFGGSDVAPVITSILGIIAIGGIRVEEVTRLRRAQPVGH